MPPNKTKALPKEISDEIDYIGFDWFQVEGKVENRLVRVIDQRYIEEMKSIASKIYHQARLQERAELGKKVREAVPKEKDTGYNRTEQEPTENEVAYLDGFNACRSQLLASVKKIFEE